MEANLVFLDAKEGTDSAPLEDRLPVDWDNDLSKDPSWPDQAIVADFVLAMAVDALAHRPVDALARVGGVLLIAVARLARSVENTLSVDRRRRVVRERVHDGIRHRRLLCEKHTGSHGRNRTCDEFDSVVHSERNYTPWLEHPRP